MKAAIIGASSESLHTIELAKARGLFVTAFDGNPKAEGLEVADEGLVVDISKEDATIDAVKKAGADFILTVPIGRFLTTIGAVNDALGLPGITAAVAKNCTDKFTFHNVLHEKGLRECACFDVTEGSMYKISFPAILKPRYGSGSRGIHYLENEGQLQTSLRLVTGEPYVLEECVEGDEYGMDAAVIDGKFYPVLLRKKENTPLPNRQAVAYYAVWEEDVFYEKAVAYMEKVTEAMGLSECLLHADLVNTEAGPFAIEVSARPSGHNLHNLFTPLATGVDLAGEYINYRMGKAFCFVPKTKRQLSIHYFDMIGKVGHVPTKKEVEETGVNLLRWECHIEEGEELAPVSDGHSVMGRGYFIIENNKKEEPALQALRIKELFKVRL